MLSFYLCFWPLSFILGNVFIASRVRFYGLHFLSTKMPYYLPFSQRMLSIVILLFLSLLHFLRLSFLKLSADLLIHACGSCIVKRPSKTDFGYVFSCLSQINVLSRIGPILRVWVSFGKIGRKISVLHWLFSVLI